MTLAANFIGSSESEDQYPQVVFLTDALSVLEVLDNGLESLTLMIAFRAPSTKSADRFTVLQWVPSHCGIPSNETADRLTKQGAAGDQEDNTVSFQEMKTLIKTCNRTPKQTEDYHLLT